MTTFARTDREQPNLVDGTIYAYETRENGCYVTVKGNGDTPLILSFDLEDVQSLRAIAARMPVDPSFSFYVEPRQVAEGVYVGVGAGDHGEHTEIISDTGSQRFDTEQLASLIDSLQVCLEVMRMH